MSIYPDVPQTPGVPNVLRLPGAIETPIVALIEDAGQLLAGTPLWGIYDNGGSPLLDVDTVLSVEYQGESTISDCPIEQGSFQSYNKVDRPYTGRVQVAKSGASVDRTTFLMAVETLKASTATCSIVTPERVYENANVIEYDHSRHADRGAQMIVVELHLQEIRQSAATTYSNTKTPDGADPVNIGPVQTTAVSIPPFSASDIDTTPAGT